MSCVPQRFGAKYPPPKKAKCAIVYRCDPVVTQTCESRWSTTCSDNPHDTKRTSVVKLRRGSRQLYTVRQLARQLGDNMHLCTPSTHTRLLQLRLLLRCPLRLLRLRRRIDARPRFARRAASSTASFSTALVRHSTTAATALDTSSGATGAGAETAPRLRPPAPPLRARLPCLPRARGAGEAGGEASRGACRLPADARLGLPAASACGAMLGNAGAPRAAVRTAQSTGTAA